MTKWLVRAIFKYTHCLTHGNLINRIKSLCNVIYDVGNYIMRGKFFITLGVWQACTLINVHIIIRKWNKTATVRVQITQKKTILLHGEEVVLMENSENDLQKSIYFLPKH